MKTTNQYNRLYKPGVSTGNDLRQLIVEELISLGANKASQTVPYGSYSKAARRFKVSVNTVKSIWKHVCTHDTVSPVKKVGRPVGSNRKVCEEDRDFLRFLVQANPVVYKRELHEDLLRYSNTLGPHNPVSVSTIYREVKFRLGPKQYSYKKCVQSNTLRWTWFNVRRTADYFAAVDELDPNLIYFLDESHFDRNVTRRLYGASEKGERAVNLSVHEQGGSHTLFLLCSLSGDIVAYVTTGGSTTETFIEFMTEALDSINENGERVIKPTGTIISDNASIHISAQRILEPSLEERGLTYMTMPTYSCDLNPCEELFSYVKRLLKKREFVELVRHDLKTAILTACDAITPAICYNVYRNVTRNYMHLA